MTCRSPKESQGWQNCCPADSKGYNVCQGSDGDCHSGMLKNEKKNIMKIREIKGDTLLHTIVWQIF